MVKSIQTYLKLWPRRCLLIRMYYIFQYTCSQFFRFSCLFQVRKVCQKRHKELLPYRKPPEIFNICTLYRNSTSLEFNHVFYPLLFVKSVQRKRLRSSQSSSLIMEIVIRYQQLTSCCCLTFISEHSVFFLSRSCMKALLRQTTNLTVFRSERVTSDHDEDLIFVPTK